MHPGPHLLQLLTACLPCAPGSGDSRADRHLGGSSAFCFLAVPLPGPLARWAPGVCKALAPFLSMSVCPCLSVYVSCLSSLPLSLPISVCVSSCVSFSLPLAPPWSRPVCRLSVALSLLLSQPPLREAQLPLACPHHSPVCPATSSPSLALPTLSGHTSLLTFPWRQPQAQCKDLIALSASRGRGSPWGDEVLPGVWPGSGPHLPPPPQPTLTAGLGSPDVSPPSLLASERRSGVERLLRGHPIL